MANQSGGTRRPPSARKKSAAKKPGGTRGSGSRPYAGKKPHEKIPSPVANEVRNLAFAALGVLLLLSVFMGASAGVVGAFLYNVLVGLFGFGAFVLPLIIIAASVFAMFSEAKKIPGRLIFKIFLFLLLLLSFVHLAATGGITGSHENVFSYIASLYEQGRAVNGGLFGGLLANMLRALLGVAGAYIFIITAGLITLVFITGRPFSRGVYRIFSNLRERSDRRADENEGGGTRIGTRIETPSRNFLRRKNYRRDNLFSNKKARQGRFKTIEIEDVPSVEGEFVLLAGEDAPKPKRNPLREGGILKRAPQNKNNVINIGGYVPSESRGEYEDGEYDAEDGEYAGGFAETDGDITVRGLVENADDEPPFDADEEIDDAPLKTESNVIELPAGKIRRLPRARKPASEPSATHENYFDDYETPPTSLLKKNQNPNQTESRTQILENSRILEETLRSFRVEAKVVEVSVGPTVTRYDMAPGPGVKVSAIANLSNDLALSLAAQGIRIEAPIPGKAAVGIEIPNKEPQPVLLREIIEDDAFKKFTSKLAIAIGKDIAGAPVVADAAQMPHLLIAGATGSGKSIFINTLIASLLYKSKPDEVKLLMIDPKMVELVVYNGIPHLLIPVVTDPKKASGALQWAVAEMEKRYSLFASVGAREIKGYNSYLEKTGGSGELLPQIVIIIDELADLMMACKGEVEEAICRLAQKARAAGIHLIVATQRPSVDVITGLIKANIPSRLAFAVSSGIDSRTVLDMYGAEKLLGKGDMLFLPSGRAKPIRLQGCYISDKETEDIVDFLKSNHKTEYSEEMIEKVTMPARAQITADDEQDEYFDEAVEFLIEKGKASTTLLQKRFRIGYNRASRLMDDLELRGIVGPEDGVKPRKILMSREEFITDFGR